MKNTKEDVNKFIALIADYDEHYGKVEVIETKTYFIIKLYNGGWSENEELEQRFLSDINIRQRYLVYDFHPLHLFVFHKILDEYEDKEVFDSFRKLHCYSKRKKFVFKMEIE